MICTSVRMRFQGGYYLDNKNVTSLRDKTHLKRTGNLEDDRRINAMPRNNQAVTYSNHVLVDRNSCKKCVAFFARFGLGRRNDHWDFWMAIFNTIVALFLK